MLLDGRLILLLVVMVVVVALFPRLAILTVQRPLLRAGIVYLFECDIIGFFLESTGGGGRVLLILLFDTQVLVNALPSRSGSIM